jgi:hypothetical protein
MIELKCFSQLMAFDRSVLVYSKIRFHIDKSIITNMSGGFSPFAALIASPSFSGRRHGSQAVEWPIASLGHLELEEVEVPCSPWLRVHGTT